MSHPNPHYLQFLQGKRQSLKDITVPLRSRRKQSCRYVTFNLWIEGSGIGRTIVCETDRDPIRLPFHQLWNHNLEVSEVSVKAHNLWQVLRHVFERELRMCAAPEALLAKPSNPAATLPPALHAITPAVARSLRPVTSQSEALPYVREVFLDTEEATVFPGTQSDTNLPEGFWKTMLPSGVECELFNPRHLGFKCKEEGLLVVPHFLGAVTVLRTVREHYVTLRLDSVPAENPLARHLGVTVRINKGALELVQQDTAGREFLQFLQTRQLSEMVLRKNLNRRQRASA